MAATWVTQRSERKQLEVAQDWWAKWQTYSQYQTLKLNGIYDQIENLELDPVVKQRMIEIIRKAGEEAMDKTFDIWARP